MNILKTNSILTELSGIQVMVSNQSQRSLFELAYNLSLHICTAVAKRKYGHCVSEPKNRPNRSPDWRSSDAPTLRGFPRSNGCRAHLVGATNREPGRYNPFQGKIGFGYG